MKQNKYFRIDEFRCKCTRCTLPNGVPSDELVELLINIREHFNAPLVINSAYRCKEHNTKVEGSKNSRHLVGDAIDFIIEGKKTKEVYEEIEKLWGSLPLGLAIKHNPNNAYGGFVHIDTRGKKARWTYN